MLSNLNHLPLPPADFRQRCRAAASAAALTALAGYRLDGTGLEQLARSLQRMKAGAPDSPPGLTPFRLGILSNATTDFMPSALIGSALRYGIDLTVVVGAYGQVLQEAMNAVSPLYAATCDAVLLALDHRCLPLDVQPGEEHGAQVESSIAFCTEIRDALKANAGTTVMFQTMPPPPETLFGSMDAVIPGTLRAILNDLNAGIRTLVRQSPGDVLVDVEAMANAIGLLEWHAPRQWNVAKLQFAPQALPQWADSVARTIGALRGRSRKCLVLDLDNTLWGGVVGDVGVNGIELGNGSALGEAFLDVQRAALLLRQRGVILAVCSKNDEAVARQPFLEHPEMLLKQEHISVFRANWIDKATNLEDIARTLDIGLDSLVLLDDNPAEREQVRQALGVVAVPELPDDPSLYARILLNAGYFDAVSFSSEDAGRAGQYSANAQRAASQVQARDLGEFLASLDMEIAFAPFDAMGRSRIAQLINKTNQFNLTTRRYTEAQVAAFEAEPGTWTRQVRLVDRFGDNGMICVVICRPCAPATWEIDTWLMSCRVLGRHVEQAVLNELVAGARAAGISRLIGRYIPTRKNAMVEDHYRKLGFSPLGSDGEATLFALDVAGFEPATVPMRVVRHAGT